MKESEKILVCPNCRCSLTRSGNIFKCKNNHSFDVSKEGYLNLLLCNSKKSCNPGDDKLMIKSRNDFLSKGYFSVLRDKLTSIINLIDPKIILDAGCGTGYYLADVVGEVLSVDISKFAVKTTSKNNKNSFAIVASIFDLPIQNESVDAILNVFAPKPQKEFAKVLKKDGYIIEVIPGEKHLMELKQVLFDIYRPNITKNALNMFDSVSSQRLTYSVTLESSDDILNLLKMTPYWYKGGEKNKEKIDCYTNFSVTFDFVINVLQKNELKYRLQNKE